MRCTFRPSLHGARAACVAPLQIFFWPAIVLAAVTSAMLAFAGLASALAVLLFMLWAASIWMLAREAPTAAPLSESRESAGAAAIADSMAAMIEHSGTPLLLTKGARITVANAAARSILGDHIMGQDPRVALRHPEAIRLMESREDGEAIIQGLVRRRDIWRLSRHVIDRHYAVIELLNRTSEADIGRAHTDFVANASHELRTPLASIIGYAETLRENADGLDAPTAEKFLDTIHREARRLQNLVNDLMSLSRIEAEKHEQPAKPVDYATLIERAAGDAAGAERRDRVRFTLARGITVAGDPQQLEQLVRNLVDNALKYGERDGIVQVRLDRGPHGGARLTVSDEGEGIASEHLPHLTRRFYRTDPGRSRASGGTGLGLAIVKHIVERHRGRLEIESAPGKGTTVIVRIPVLEEHTQEAGAA